MDGRPGVDAAGDRLAPLIEHLRSLEPRRVALAATLHVAVGAVGAQPAMRKVLPKLKGQSAALVRAAIEKLDVVASLPRPAMPTDASLPRPSSTAQSTSLPRPAGTKG
jgi:hypothetical protein